MTHPLKLALRRAKTSQNYVAHCLRVHPASLNRYLQGNRPMPPELQQRMTRLVRHLQRLIDRPVY